MLRTAATALLLVLSALTVKAATPDPTELDLERSFVETVRPFLVNYCISCHSGEKPMAQFDLGQYSNLASCCSGSPSLVAGAREAHCKADAAPASPAAGSRSSANGDRLDRCSPQERGEKERRGSRPGTGPPAEQRRVQLHYPRSNGRGHQADAGIPGRSRQSRRL